MYWWLCHKSMYSVYIYMISWLTILMNNTTLFHFNSFFIITGHTLRLVDPIKIVWPERKGSVLETLMRTDMYLAVARLGRKTMSFGERWISGENFLLQVSSPRRKKPKNAIVIAAQIIIESLFRDVWGTASKQKTYFGSYRLLHSQHRFTREGQ